MAVTVHLGAAAVSIKKHVTISMAPVHQDVHRVGREIIVIKVSPLTLLNHFSK